MLNLKTNRLDELLGTITEARKSLQNWQDQRTEALIQLDALSYDIRQIEEEKNRSAELITALKAEIEDRAKVYQSHVESITDQMQLLKVEKEDVSNSLNEAIERLQKQLDESELQRNRQRESEAEIVATWEKRLAEQKADFEVRYAEQQHRHREQVEGLNTEINTLLEKIEILKSQAAETEMRADRNDRDLQVFRSQMMNLLRVSETENLSSYFKPGVSTPAPQAIPAPQPIPAPQRAPSAVAESPRARFDDRPANPYIIPTAEALSLASQGLNQNGERVSTPAAGASSSANASGSEDENASAAMALASSAAVSAAAKRARTASGAAGASGPAAGVNANRTVSPTVSGANPSGAGATARPKPTGPSNNGELRMNDGFVVAGGVTAQLSADSTVEEYLKRLGY
jgi:hypothetical protein